MYFFYHNSPFVFVLKKKNPSFFVSFLFCFVFVLKKKKKLLFFLCNTVASRKIIFFFFLFLEFHYFHLMFKGFFSAHKVSSCRLCYDFFILFAIYFFFFSWKKRTSSVIFSSLSFSILFFSCSFYFGCDRDAEFFCMADIFLWKSSRNTWMNLEVILKKKKTSEFILWLEFFQREENKKIWECI